VTIDDLKLGLALEAKYKRILALPILCYGRMELGQPLQASEFVEDKPYRFLLGPWGVELAKHKQVDPKTVKRTKGFTLRCL
jgi:hypothetical protein